MGRYETHSDRNVAKVRSGVGVPRDFCWHSRRVIEQKKRLSIGLSINGLNF